MYTLMHSAAIMILSMCFIECLACMHGMCVNKPRISPNSSNLKFTGDIQIVTFLACVALITENVVDSSDSTAILPFLHLLQPQTRNVSDMVGDQANNGSCRLVFAAAVVTDLDLEPIVHCLR